MKKSFFIMLALLTALSMVLGACGATPAPTTAPNRSSGPADCSSGPADRSPADCSSADRSSACRTGKHRLWTKEGEADGGLQFVQALADAYTAANPNVTFDIANKDVETLREDFLTAGLAGSLPTCCGPSTTMLAPSPMPSLSCRSTTSLI